MSGSFAGRALRPPVSDMIAPLIYPLATYRTAAVAAFRQIGRNNLGLIAAGVAFFSMLSLFPALAALIAVLSLIADPAVVIVQLERFSGLMPADVYQILNTQIVGLVSASSDTLGWAGGVSLFLALWSARAGVGAVMQGLNAVYGMQGRATWRHYLRALFLTVSLVLVGVTALLMVVVVPVVLAFLPLGTVAGIALEVLRWTIAITVIFAGIGLLYRFGPNRSGIPIGWVTPGAVFSVMSWAAVSVAFSFYVSHFGNYNEVYGSIGAVVAMLVWLWISTFLVLLGAALNAELELRRNLPGSEAVPADVTE
ncbi:YihY/virulence factor BrkB family protein [uncultured Roseobacter sp.]|uniref:YihY/virulence factor BrkB family protein n=1 Tax=uncultured Roseobacter sp. TaxID=114847 RepID=UPI00261F4467|nr:YihY/virulence factor BrkB family protein [uncultured Roseobacter sp.]